MKTLWTEKFNPQPFEPTMPTETDFDKAWDWMFEKDSAGQFVRAGLCLIMVHGISKEFHRAGCQDTGQMAVVALYRRYSGQIGVTGAIPKRKNAPAGIPRRRAVSQAGLPDAADRALPARRLVPQRKSS